jgi:hypothetical protein
VKPYARRTRGAARCWAPTSPPGTSVSCSSAPACPGSRSTISAHTAATLLLALGTHPNLVQELLGHSSIALTPDVYSHVMPSMHDEAANTMDRILTR